MKRLIPIGASALVACALLVPSAVAVSVMDIPTVLPPGSSGNWPMCESPEDQMCIDSVSVQVGGQGVDYGTAGLAAQVSTLEGSVSSLNWSIQGSWNVDSALPQGFDSALLDADLSLVIRVGAWVPRMTSALAKDLRITVSGDDTTGRTLTLSGKPIHIDWDPTLSSCYSPLTAGACGDDTTRATDVGSGWRFMGNTQDMGTWSEGEQSQRGGMYVATDAQGGPHMAPLALQFTTYPETYWELKLGNPHLDVNGNPVRGSFNAWLPESYFTSLETTVDAAIATGFSVASAADGVTTLISPDVTKVDGGVMISLVDIGYSVRTLTVRNEPVPPLAAPGVPTAIEVQGQGRPDEIRVLWQEPASGGAATSYVANAYTSALGNTIAGTCSSGIQSPLECTIRGPQAAALDSNTSFYVSVVASNTAGDSDPSARQSVLTLPAKPTLTKSTVTSSSVAFTFSKQSGVTYTATAKVGQVSVPAGQVAVSTSNGPGKVTITGLSPATRVSVTLRASNVPDNYLSSDAVTHTTLAAKPTKVSGLAVSKIKSGKVTLTWNAVPGTGAPVVYRYRWVKKGSSAWSSWVEVSALKGVVSGWAKGTQYTVQIFARNSAGDAPTASATFTAS
ncbi:MAG: fibronectin type III domain-containing protein [Actinobacteria bacterium]|nr:fibronectin type III domain-containing protein [Actinomycetota bacterium]